MSESTIFGIEEQTVKDAEEVLCDEEYKDNSLLNKFSQLLKNYIKIYRQLRRLIRISDKQQLRLNDLNKDLDVRNSFIKQTFGRYLSDEIVENILEKPEGLNLGGEKREVTIMMSDLRGFTPICEQLPAEDVVGIINIYLKIMTEIIFKYNGTIDEFIGDAILVIFGAPILRNDDAIRAVACALEMQLAMKEVNALCRKKNYPEIKQGIGINTGTVVVGNLGSAKRIKYGVVGHNVNLTSRIESYTTGGEIYISEKTAIYCNPLLRIDDNLEVKPKGVKKPIKIFEIGGIGGDYNIFLPKKNIEFTELKEPIKVKFRILAKKYVSSEYYDGLLLKLNANNEAIMKTDVFLHPLDNLHISLFDQLGNILTNDLYAKASDKHNKASLLIKIDFTSIPDEVKKFINQALSLESQ